MQGLIIRNDHDELYHLLKRFKYENTTIINFDRHHDTHKHPEINNGSWAYHAIKDNLCSRYIWIPLENEHEIRYNEGIEDLSYLKISKRPFIISICYDYFIGLNLDTSLLEITNKFEKIFKHTYGTPLNFIYAARSPQWTNTKYLNLIDELLLKYTKAFDIPLSKLSQPIINQEKHPIP